MDGARGKHDMAILLALHGPNLNLLGSREPELYGKDTLAEINQQLQRMATAAEHRFESMQSNAEHVLIDRVQQAQLDNVAFILLNPAALTHSSVALRDALQAVAIPFIEIHLSNIFCREPFRRHSYFTDIACGMVCGLGAFGYQLAMQAAIERLRKP